MRQLRAAVRAVAEMGALVTTLAAYWSTVFPLVSRELAGWRTRAEEIADVRLRDLALTTLIEEGSLAEGAAIFATLVPRRHRRGLVRLLVAWQVAYDYLDTIGEELHAQDLYDSLLLALDPSAPLGPCSDDGGYLAALVECCRAEAVRLKSFASVQPIALRAAARCGEAQIHTHAVRLNGADRLRCWAIEQGAGADFLWWEVSAGAISSLAVHATLALAALPDATVHDATEVDRAYFPAICAVSTLLDCAIDETSDRGTTNHRTNDYYDDAAHALARLAEITRRAATDARALPSGRRHLVILAGMTALYAVSDARGDTALHARVSQAVGAATTPIAWTLRLRRALSGARGVTTRETGSSA